MKLTKAYVFTTEAGLEEREGTITLVHKDLEATLLVTVTTEYNSQHHRVYVDGFTRGCVGNRLFKHSSPYSENSSDALEMIEFINLCVDEIAENPDLSNEIFTVFYDKKLNELENSIEHLRDVVETSRLVNEFCRDNNIESEIFHKSELVGKLVFNKHYEYYFKKGEGYVHATRGAIADYVSTLRCRNTKDYAL